MQIRQLPNTALARQPEPSGCDYSTTRRRNMKISFGISLLTATGFILASVPATNALTCGNLNKTEWKGNFQGGNINSTSFLTLDTSDLTFTVGGTGKSCVLVTFSILGAASDLNPDVGNSIRFQGILDEV